MTQAIKTQQQLMREALSVLTFIEVMEGVGLTNDIVTYQKRYSELMAKLSTELLEVCSNEDLDNYMQSLPSMVVNATANGLLDTTATVNAMHNIFSGQVTKATQQAQLEQEDYFGENR